MKTGGQEKDPDIPFGLDPILIFSSHEDTISHRLCTYSLYIPSTIIVNDSGNLRGPADIFMGRKPTKRSIEQRIEDKFDAPGHPFDFWDSSRLDHTVIKLRIRL